MKHIWSGWKKLIQKITKAQVNIILTIIFVTIVIPLSYIKRMLDKLLNSHNQDREEKSYWKNKTKSKDIKNWARKL